MQEAGRIWSMTLTVYRTINMHRENEMNIIDGWTKYTIRFMILKIALKGVKGELSLQSRNL